MAELSVTGSNMGSSLSAMLMCDDIEPGSEPSYQMCKTIYLYHPIGQKMAEAPIKMAQFLPREITVTDGPEEDLIKAFVRQWKVDGYDSTIRSVASQARVYGVASLALLVDGCKPDEPLDADALADANIAFNVLDPLNTAGSLVLNQDPNSLDFQKHKDIAVNGVRYHRSRTITLMNEQPIYIHYTSSAFGFVGRSVYQRALFPLKSFVNTMRADDMVARKAGLIVAALKAAGSIVDSIMMASAAFKRRILKVAETDNVVSISEGETVTSLDLTNIDGPLALVRKNILENIAAAADMPAKLLNNETFAEGFGEGTEDAKAVAAYIDSIRQWLDPLYMFLDMVAQRRAWNKRFFAAMQSKYPDRYGKMEYEQAFYEWQNSFNAAWPSLLREPESEQVRVDDVKLKAVIAAVQVFLPELDPENKVLFIEWAVDQLNATKKLISGPLDLDYDALRNYTPPTEGGEEGGEEGDGEKKPAPAAPFSARDSAIAAFLGSKSEDVDVRRRITQIEGHLRKAGRA